MDIKKVASSVKTTLDSLGNVEMGGIRLDSPTPEMLDLNSLSMDIHVAMHPALVAYYGAVRRDAAMELAILKRAYERWHLKMWSESKVKACGGSQQYKPTVNDIEARLIVDHEKELEDWDERLEGAQTRLNDLESLFEALRQKSFALRDHAAIEEEERFTAGGGTMTRDDRDVR